MWKIIEINMESLSDNPGRIFTLSGNIFTNMVTATLRSKNGTLDTKFSKNGFYRSQFFPTGSKIKEEKNSEEQEDPGTTRDRSFGGGTEAGVIVIPIVVVSLLFIIGLSRSFLALSPSRMSHCSTNNAASVFFTSLLQ